jgi:hypothetical protein
VPEYKEFTVEEANIKTCDFDREAEAVIIFDVASANYNEQYNLVFNRRIRFKILKEKGIRRGNIEIPFWSKDQFETLLKVKAAIQTIDENGRAVVKEIKHADIFYQKVSDQHSVARFALPNVKVGSIIEYSYESLCKHYGGLRDWHFQSDIPTMLSSLSLIVVPNAEFQYVVRKSPDMPIEIQQDNQTFLSKFRMRDVAGLRDEPFMDAERDYIQRIEFQLAGYRTSTGSKINYINSWGEVSKELMTESYFGRQIDKKLPNAEEILLKVKDLTAEAKLKYIHDFVRKNFTWTGTNSRFVEDGIKGPWESRKGNSAELNFICMNLLKAVGINVSPLLASNRNHGKVTTDYPILDQFNKVVAYVVIDNRTYIVDATDQYTPLHLIPFNILNTNAFIVSIKKGRIIQLKDEVSSLTNNIDIRSVINENGSLSGTATIKSSDYARVERVTQVRQSKESFKSRYLLKNNESMRIDSVEVTNTESDSLSLDQHFKYEGMIATNGDYKLINLNQFTTLEKNPFIGDSRFTNINFGTRRVTNVHENFVIPPSLKPEELPKNITLTTPDKSFVFKRNTTYKDNQIDVELSFTINQSVFAAEDYAGVKEYYKKMNSILNEQIVLRSK